MLAATVINLLCSHLMHETKRAKAVSQAKGQALVNLLPSKMLYLLLVPLWYMKRVGEVAIAVASKSVGRPIYIALVYM